ncbi:hypothetical protein CI109_104196 [Kwoniella shandongensis]|uniref:Uncharacterized protein n=1 Tax=Kwoniella shandongensis TaxID=1734106 RepID=A0A5M6C5H7_9TREE|nr:uncharacterized protein CI109_002893 [Kwoniella shandongensis]KAA5528735.1 hypothetical protein CI109_002893 [Kwoniella shandongensis]
MSRQASSSAYKPMTVRLRTAIASAGDIITDERASDFPLVVYLSDALDRPPSVLANSTLLLLISLILLNPYDLSPILTNLIGFVPSAYCTLQQLISSENAPPTPPSAKQKGIENQRKEVGKRWLDYWVIFGTSLFIEDLLGEEVLFTFVPFYWAFKVVGIVWFFLGLVGVDVEKGKKTETHKPKPLRLKARNKNNAGIEVVRSAGEPEPEPEERGNATQIDKTKSTENVKDLSSQKDPSPSKPHGDNRVGDIDHPALSSTPVFSRIPHTPSSLSTPDSDASSPFDLSSVASLSVSSADSDADSDSESDSDEDDDEISSPEHETSSHSDSGSDTDSTSSDPDSASDTDSNDSDDSTDIMLPPGTPLDELALRGLKTVMSPIASPAPVSPADDGVGPVVEDETGDHKVQEQRSSSTPDSTQKLEVGMVEPAKAKVDGAGVLSNDDNVDANLIIKSDESPTKMSVIPAGEGGSKSKSDDDKLQSAPVFEAESVAAPLEAVIKSSEAEGEITKLSLDDLLAIAMEGEGDAPDGEQEEDVEVVINEERTQLAEKEDEVRSGVGAGVEVAGLGTAPLNIKKDQVLVES